MGIGRLIALFSDTPDGRVFRCSDACCDCGHALVEVVGTQGERDKPSNCLLWLFPPPNIAPPVRPARIVEPKTSVLSQRRFLRELATEPLSKRSLSPASTSQLLPTALYLFVRFRCDFQPILCGKGLESVAENFLSRSGDFVI
jgi:hypothetical protein